MKCNTILCKSDGSGWYKNVNRRLESVGESKRGMLRRFQPTGAGYFDLNMDLY